MRTAANFSRNDPRSEARGVLRGIPQGSRLGPLLSSPPCTLRDKSRVGTINATKKIYRLLTRILTVVSHLASLTAAISKMFWWLRPQLVSLSLFQYKCTQQRGKKQLKGERTIGQSHFCLCDMTSYRAERLIEYAISQGEGEKYWEKVWYTNHNSIVLHFFINHTNAVLALLASLACVVARK